MPQFIEEYNIPESTCDKMIQLFEDNPDKHSPGKIGKDRDIKKHVKDSTDFSFYFNFPDKRVAEYLFELASCVKQYTTKYIYADKIQSSWSIQEELTIQKYTPGGGFKKWHCERAGPRSNRHLVFMTYLNTLKKGGTEFFYQEKEYNAVKGLTLIWPTDWPFTHKGVISDTETKYIITGYLSYN